MKWLLLALLLSSAAFCADEKFDCRIADLQTSIIKTGSYLRGLDANMLTVELAKNYAIIQSELDIKNPEQKWAWMVSIYYVNKNILSLLAEAMVDGFGFGYEKANGKSETDLAHIFSNHIKDGRILYNQAIALTSMKKFTNKVFREAYEEKSDRAFYIHFNELFYDAMLNFYCLTYQAALAGKNYQDILDELAKTADHITLDWLQKSIVNGYQKDIYFSVMDLSKNLPSPNPFKDLVSIQDVYRNHLKDLTKGAMQTLVVPARGILPFDFMEANHQELFLELNAAINHLPPNLLLFLMAAIYKDGDIYSLHREIVLYVLFLAKNRLYWYL